MRVAGGPRLHVADDRVERVAPQRRLRAHPEQRALQRLVEARVHHVLQQHGLARDVGRVGVDVLVPRELLGHVDDALAQRRRLQRHRHLDVSRHLPHVANVLRDQRARAGGGVGEHQVQRAHLAPDGGEQERGVLLRLG